MSHSFGVQADQRLAGGDQVAVLDEPLDDGAAVRRGHRRSRRAGSAPRRSWRPGASVRALGAGPATWWNVPLAGATSIRQVGVVSIGERVAVLVAERAGVVELVGGLERERLDALERPLGDPGQGAGRRHLEDPGDAEVGHRLHAEVPAHRVADLGDDPPEHLAAVVDDLAVAVGDQRRARVVGGDRPGQPCRARRRPGAMCSVWNAPATDSGISRAFAGGSSASAASCSTVPAATIWPAPLSLAGGQPVLRRARRAPPRGRRRAPRSCRSGWPPRPSAIALAALADEHHRLLGGDAPGRRPRRSSSPTLWPGDRADPAERVGRVREQLERGEQAGGDQQRLGDGGVADRLGVGLGAVVDQVEAGDGGQPVEPLGEGAGPRARASRKPGVWAPCPGATMTSTPPLCRVGRRGRAPGDARRSAGRLCRNPTTLRAPCVGSGRAGPASARPGGVGVAAGRWGRAR